MQENIEKQEMENQYFDFLQMESEFYQKQELMELNIDK